MNKRITIWPGLCLGALLLAWGQANSAGATVLADSITDFSGDQGSNGWFYGYRNVTADGKGLSYDAAADFIPFDASLWVNAVWDLDAGAGGAPWTTIDKEAIHPNGANNAEEHWAIRRWSASELTGTTLVTVTWQMRKQNVGGGNGVTGALYVNGQRKQAATIAFNNAVGVTNVCYLSTKPADLIDLILSPVGTDGVSDDGSDGSLNSMRIETATDTDGDGLADDWEYKYFPNDLTKLTATGDFDNDGLTDAQEMVLGTDPTKTDTDGDGLKDSVETNTGVFVSATNTGTNPLNPDTDTDGRTDADEINGAIKTDPFKPDTDGDGFTDGDEVASGYNPNDAADYPGVNALANSSNDFSGVQGQADWFGGYRNYSADGGGDNYDPTTGFIAFAGGDGLGDWDGTTQLWTGSQWDLNTAAAGPWTELGKENTHPNSSPVHWSIRRWVANQLTKATPLAFRWHVHKSNTGGGNGVTGGLYINGKLMDKAIIGGADGVGVTRTYFANVSPGDKVDLTLSPRGADGVDSDGSDGSINRFLVDPTIPADPRQPDGSVFIPVGAGDSDGDGIPDAWEKLYFPNDLSKLTATGDFDQDGLSDKAEYQRSSDPTKADTDGDGLGDLVETGTGQYVSPTDTGTDPAKADTDGDGLSDSQEVTLETNPNKVDTDGDSFSDKVEVDAGTDPKNAADNPQTYVIANSQKEFSGVQGSNGWYYGYRQYDPAKGETNYDANVEFVPFPGGAGQGDWAADTQTWTGSAWDLNTEAAAPWTSMADQSVHPNGTNSPPNDFEHWVTRRWVANALTKVTPAALIWSAKKENAANDGVTVYVFINGKMVDSVGIGGTDTTGQVRRVYANLKPKDIVDLALSPAGPSGDRNDWSDASITWLNVDLRIPANPVQPDGTPFIPAGRMQVTGSYDRAQSRFTITWPSDTGLKYSVWGSSDLKAWTAVKTGIDSGGTTTSYSDTETPQPKNRYYRISQP